MAYEYTYKDGTLVVTSDSDPHEARLYYPDEATIDMQASLLLRRPVRCKRFCVTDNFKKAIYSIRTETRPYYVIRFAAQLADLDVREALQEHGPDHPEYNKASARAAEAHRELLRFKETYRSHLGPVNKGVLLHFLEPFTDGIRFVVQGPEGDREELGGVHYELVNGVGVVVLRTRKQI